MVYITVYTTVPGTDTFHEYLDTYDAAADEVGSDARRLKKNHKDIFFPRIIGKNRLIIIINSTMSLNED